MTNESCSQSAGVWIIARGEWQHDVNAAAGVVGPDCGASLA